MTSYAELKTAADAAPRDFSKATALLKFVRGHQLRKPAVVARYGAAILNDRRAASRLGDEVWSVYEQTLLAALDVDDGELRDACEAAILERFDSASTPSQRVERLKGLVRRPSGKLVRWS